MRATDQAASLRLIQGIAGAFVVKLVGSYSGVVGLPLFETARLLQDSGVSGWQQDATDHE